MRRHAKASSTASSTRETRPSHTGLGTSLVFALLFLVCTSSALAAPKQIVNQLGSSETGETGGRFKAPHGVAVNRTGAGGVPAGTTYVVDSGNLRVQRLSPSGTFVSAWGWGVREGNLEAELCSKADECQAGKEGVGAGQFKEPTGIAVDQATGNVYVADPGPGPGRRVNIFDAKGGFQGAFGLGVLGDFSAQYEFCTTATGCGESFFAEGQGGGFPEGIGGIAIDPAGDVYVGNPGYRRIDVFRPVLSGQTVVEVEFLRSFGWGVSLENEEFETCTVSSECRSGLAGSGAGQFAEGSPTDIVIDSEGNVFALDAGNERIQEFNAASEPIESQFGAATLTGVFGGGDLFNLAVDPTVEPNHLLVAGQRADAGDKVAVAELDHSGANALGSDAMHGEDLEVTQSFGLAAVPTSLGGAIDLAADQVGLLHGAYVLNERPTVEAITDVTGTTALFKGHVVSNEIEVTYHFEYSLDGKHWTSVPSPDADAGAQPGEIEVEQEATGLSGSQTYSVRLVQSRALGGVAISSVVTFATLSEKPAVLGGVASPVEDTRTTFNAYLDPQGEATTYHFEYGLSDCGTGGCTPLPASPAGAAGLRLVAQLATGLQPGTVYHFRLVASNATGMTTGPDRVFQTFTPGHRLPDDRAYELVTPPDTAAVVLNGLAFGEAGGPDCFDTFASSSDGNSLITAPNGGGVVPNMQANGFWDLYESVRGPGGWTTAAKSATVLQSSRSGAGLCTSPDHSYSTLRTDPAPGAEGTLVIDGKASSYIRGPEQPRSPACAPEADGSYELVGCGSLGTDPEANTRWITDDAAHVIFISRQKLESDAPESGIETVYDRTPGGSTAVVSLPPAGASPATKAEFETLDAEYQGTSFNGATVAFDVGDRMYVHRGGETVPVVPGGAGTTLNCTTSASTATVEYQWLRNGAPIAGETASSYATVAADAGTAVQCQVFARQGSSGATQVSNPAALIEPRAAVAPPKAPNNINPPSTSGTLTVPGPAAARTLTCATGSWGGAPAFSFQWYANGVAIAAATASTYVVQANTLTVGTAFQCAVTGTNASGSTTKLSGLRLSSPGPSPSVPAPIVSTGGETPVFGGLSRDGSKLFYEREGNVFAFEPGSGDTAQLSTGGSAKFVNVSEEGSHAYFISPQVLTGSEENQQGAAAEEGLNNLYDWDAADDSVSFVASVPSSDLLEINDRSLIAWTNAAVYPTPQVLRGRAIDPSRTTPDGSVLVFESHGNLTDFDNRGHIEIYRYDSDSGDLDCVSCPPPGVVPTTDAALQQLNREGGEQVQVNSALLHVQNVTDDGSLVFFETKEPLVPADINGTWDVYGWKLGQQAYLISSGRSPLPSMLYAMTPSGSDVFFTSNDRLVSQDPSTLTSIYDAREGGGFPAEAISPPCQGDPCQGTPVSPPQLPGAGSNSVHGPGNPPTRQQVKKKKKRHQKHRKKRHAAKQGQGKGVGHKHGGAK